MVTLAATSTLTKITTLFIALAIILIFATSTFARDSTSMEPISSSSATPSSRPKDKIQRLERKNDLMMKLEERRAEIASKAAKLKERLNKFKDKVKASIVERLNNNLNRINQNQTDQMRKHLDKMSGLLTKLDRRVSEATSTASQNTASASAAVAEASASIASASAAVETQSLKDYTIQISTESAIKKDSKTMRDKLHQDLRSTRQSVIEAKKALANAIRVVATTLKGVKLGQ